MSGISFDMSGLDHLAADLTAAVDEVNEGAPKAVRKAGREARQAWREAAGTTAHFKIGPTVTMSEEWKGDTLEVSVGPDRRYRSARLAGISIWGGANGGGGRGPKPETFMDVAADTLGDELGKLVSRVLS